MEFDYEQELKKQLGKDRWLRNLFNKVGTEVTVCTRTGQHIVGILKTIQFARGVINLQVRNQAGAYFLNWRHIEYVRAKE